MHTEVEKINVCTFLGKLSWDALPYDPIRYWQLCVVAIGVVLLAFLTYQATNCSAFTLE